MYEGFFKYGSIYRVNYNIEPFSNKELHLPWMNHESTYQSNNKGNIGYVLTKLP